MALATRVPVTHRTVRANGVNIHLAEAGAPGPPVLLLHGFPELWYSWRHQLPALARAGHHAVALDLRGYGRSSVPGAPGAYAMCELVGDVMGVLDRLGARAAVLVGHDWGAEVAWNCARRHPHRVAGVVGLSVPVRPRPALPVARLARRGPATGSTGCCTSPSREWLKRSSRPTSRGRCA